MRHLLGTPRKRRGAIVAAALVGALAATALGTGLHSAYATAEDIARPAAEYNLAEGFADLAERVMPAVVSVRVESVSAPELMSDRSQRRSAPLPFPEGSPFHEFFRQFPGLPENPQPRGPERRGASIGSGFIISADGYIVTNNHVVEGAGKVSVSMTDGTEYTAEIVGSDPATDLAVLKIESDIRLPHVDFADGDIRVGDWVIAVGNPFGLGGTVTSGIVSARGREIGAGSYVDFLQIDAPINRGNSGGPTFNLRGEVVGVNTAIYSPSGGNVGIGFAIPASLARGIVADLIDRGHVKRGWLGVEIQQITADIAESLGLNEARGAILTNVRGGTPAEAAELIVGDAILSVNGAEVESPRDLARKIASIRPGDIAELEILRNGQRQIIEVEIGAREDGQQASLPQADAEKSVIEDMGLDLALSQDGEGVMISGVAPGGRAAEIGLRPGDRILSIGGLTVATPAEVQHLLAEAAAADRSSILLLIRRGDSQQFVAMPLAAG